MSSLYTEDSSTGKVMSDTQLGEKAKIDIQRARSYRRRFEPIWKQNLAMAAGQHWLEVDRYTRQLALPDRYRDKELYTADVITEYRTHVLGELGSDDDRPELLLARDDQPSEDYQQQLNRAVAYGWEHEWDGDDTLSEARRLCVDMGVSAVRCHFDPDSGPAMPGMFPHLAGKPVLAPQQQTELFANGPRPDVKMKQIRQGRICWQPLSAFNILVPPGVPHEKYFPWECVVRPALLADVKAQYGPAAADLVEDADIGSLLGDATMGGSAGLDQSLNNGGDAGRLHGYVWLFTYFVRPTKTMPEGQTLVLGGNQMKLLDVQQTLPYQAPSGDWRSGIAYFHWWRVTGRFWSRGLVDVMKDVQRGVNKRRTQINEIIDRGMPGWFVQKDSNAMTASGAPGAFVELDAGEKEPVAFGGIQPGSWMQADVEAMREDLEHATGVRGPRLGDNPTNVNTYSQLALLNEQDAVKREGILTEHKRAIGQLVEDSVYDIRTYWGPQRQVMLAGDEDQIDAATFDATRVPPFFIVRTPTGTAKPRSQAAELKKVEDIAQYSLNSHQPLPVRWLKDSLEAGQALEIPEQPTDDQADKAQLENHMLLQGADVPVSYFDPPGTHIPIHRSAQIQAEMSDDQAAWDRIETHVQAHLKAAMLNAQRTAVAQQNAPVGVPPSPAPPPAAAAQP